MSKCSCYCEETIFIPLYSPFTGQIVERKPMKCGICNGTKERDECSCEGERNRCDFYPEVREKALNEQEHKFGEWISVKDGLPKKETPIQWKNRKGYNSVRVLCVCKQKSGKVLVKEGYCEMWNDDEPYWRISGSIDSVTHWMPLPEPPKGE